jgi:hypothetical protein
MCAAAPFSGKPSAVVPKPTLPPSDPVCPGHWVGPVKSSTSIWENGHFPHREVKKKKPMHCTKTALPLAPNHECAPRLAHCPAQHADHMYFSSTTRTCVILSRLGVGSILRGAGCAAKRPLICAAAAATGTLPCCLASRLPPSPRQRHPARLPAAATLPSCCHLGPSCCHPAATLPRLQPTRPSHLAAATLLLHRLAATLPTRLFLPCPSCYLAAAATLPQLLPPAAATRLLPPGCSAATRLLCCHPAALLPPGCCHPAAATRLLCCHPAALLPPCHLDAAILPLGPSCYLAAAVTWLLLSPGCCCHPVPASATRLLPPYSCCCHCTLPLPASGCCKYRQPYHPCPTCCTATPATLPSRGCPATTTTVGPTTC